MYTLENNQLRIQVASMGAELKSIYSKIKQKEYLWQADPKWWGRSAPHLFPRIGYETNEYIDKYNIIKHGYARDTDFDLMSQTSNTLSFKLKDELIITYELIENSLSINYEVLADFPYMIGCHPAFNIDSLPVELRFSNKYDYYLLKNGVIDRSKSHEIVGNKLTINNKTFKNDALVFNNNFKKSQAILGRELIITYDSELFGVWAPEGAPFVCLEPWWVDIICTFNSYSYKIEIL